MASRRVISKGKRRTKGITKGKGKKRMTTRRNRQNKKYGGEPDTRTKRRSTDSEQTETLEDVVKRVRDEKRSTKQATEQQEEALIEQYRLFHAKLGPRRSRRGKLIERKTLDPDLISGSKGYDGHTQYPTEYVKNFVYKNLKDGPQFVVFPVNNLSHAILIDVQPEKIMISDWKGDPYEFIRNDDVRYRNYFEIMKFLQEKYRRPIEFYPIDPFLKYSAKHIPGNNTEYGGCSNYIDAWADAYYINGYYDDSFVEL
jgi:hypothetical protein